MPLLPPICSLSEKLGFWWDCICCNNEIWHCSYYNCKTVKFLASIMSRISFIALLHLVWAEPWWRSAQDTEWQWKILLEAICFKIAKGIRAILTPVSMELDQTVSVAQLTISWQLPSHQDWIKREERTTSGDGSCRCWVPYLSFALNLAGGVLKTLQH